MEENNSGNQIVNQAVNTQGNSNQTNTQNTNQGVNIPKAYQPISAWGYVGWDILFAIPVVGFIILLVFACGGTSNINRKKYCVLTLIKKMINLKFIFLRKKR